MNLTVLRYALYDRIKPIYHLAEGDKFLLTAKIDNEQIPAYTTHTNFQKKEIISKNKENGLYFMRVVMNKKPMWEYIYVGYHKKYANWFEMEYTQHLFNPKDSGVIENKIFYKSMREENMKDYLVLYE